MKTLQTLRQQIDRVDQQLLRLLSQRAVLTIGVGEIKRRTGAATFVPEREEELLAKLKERNPGPLTAQGLQAIYREILSASRASQKPLRIGYVGKGEGRTLAAARARFGTGETYVGFATPGAMLRAVHQDKVEVGLLPREDMQRTALAPAERKALGKTLWLCSEVIVPEQSKRAHRYLLVSPRLPVPVAHNRTLLLVQGKTAAKTLLQASKAAQVRILEEEKVVIGTGRGVLIEVEGHLTELRLEKFLKYFQEKTLWHHVLGSYPAP
jgi:chorismate mutase-like protein